MNGIDAIIFDLGNVLVHVDEERAASRLGARVGKQTDEVLRYFRTTPYATEFALGKHTRRQFYFAVAKDLKFDGTYEEFVPIWCDMFSPIEPMVALAESLKTRLPRVILSNTNALHIDYVAAQFPWYNEFDAHILSFEVGLLKPDAAIYEHTLRQCGLTAGRTLFIDDIHANIEGARRVGLRGIVYQNADQIGAELTALGIAPR